MSSVVKFANGQSIPLELHKVRVVQKLNLQPIERRLAAIREGGFNTFLLNTTDVFLDMLTDSGTNAMSDNQVASMMHADDAYAGSQSYLRMEKAINDVFGKKLILPVHQGRAAENVISQAFLRPGTAVPMNYHFTTTKAHMELNGATVYEIFTDEAVKINSDFPFKGNVDIQKFRDIIKKYGAQNIPFIRLEAGTNLIGGQPFSIANMREVRKVATEHGIKVVLDASLICENVYFILQREEEFKKSTPKDVILEMSRLSDCVYFSSRKVSCTRGGAICTNDHDMYMKMRDLIPLYEGFLTYGGMSVREIEAMAVGLYEIWDFEMISQSPQFIKYMVDELDKNGVPVVKPAGGLGCHVDCMSFLKHIPQSQYPAGALAAAFYLVSGVRGMERGTISSVRNADGTDLLADMELLRLAMPRRVFTLSQVMYAVDRMVWLYKNRDMIGGLKFVEEPPVLRFFVGKLDAVNDWPEKLMAKFRADFGDSL
jgi:tryptophanase